MVLLASLNLSQNKDDKIKNSNNYLLHFWGWIYVNSKFYSYIIVANYDILFFIFNLTYIIYQTQLLECIQINRTLLKGMFLFKS